MAMVGSVTQALRREARIHWAGIVLACLAAAVTITPHIMLWNEPDYRGIEMMMLDAENHYMARINEVQEGFYATGNTFLADKEKSYTTPPLGEMVIGLLGKMAGLDAPRAAIISKPISVFLISILIYILAFLLSRSRIAALIAMAIPVFGYNVIAFSAGPLLSLFSGAPEGGPFLIFSRLVNPSLSNIVLFGALILILRLFLENREKISWVYGGLLGAFIASSLYMSPYVYSFLGVLLLIAWGWFLARREYPSANTTFFAGSVAILCSVPFLVNYLGMFTMPEYETVVRTIGLIPKREFILGVLLPLMAATVVCLWPKTYPKEAKVFLLLAFLALCIVLNQQLISGSYLHPGHYHWYITKPLAGIVAGIFVGNGIVRFVPAYARTSVTLVILGILVYNSFGFLAPRYESTRATALETQGYAPLMTFLNTLDVSKQIWTDVETSHYIPIYTKHDVPNNLHVGLYLNDQSFLDNRLFLEYRLREVEPEHFEETIRREAHHVADRLWGLWLRELTGDSAAIPEEEFARLAAEYKAFSALSWDEAFDALGIKLVAVRVEDRASYDAVPIIREKARAGDFVIFERI
jgi:hypothetical protein